MARERDRLGLEGTFYTLAFNLALRGEELPLIELWGLRNHWEQGAIHPKLHVTIALLGRFKSKIVVSYHLMPVLAKTPGGLQPQKWVLSEYDKRGVVSGYMFNNQDGNRARARAIEDKFHERLQAIQSTRWDLIPESTDVTEEYGTSRSLRRGSTSVTANKGAHPQVIEFNGRWRKSGASRPNVMIREHYTDIRLVLDQMLEFSRFL